MKPLTIRQLKALLHLHDRRRDLCGYVAPYDTLRVLKDRGLIRGSVVCGPIDITSTGDAAVRAACKAAGQVTEDPARWLRGDRDGCAKR